MAADVTSAAWGRALWSHRMDRRPRRSQRNWSTPGRGSLPAEWQATKSTVLSATYSRAYFDRVFSTDPSTGTLVGYGFAGSANSNNRAIQEGTFATQRTLWKRAGYGSVQMITQSSYIIRAPWFVASGTPKNAHDFAGYANLRYVLP